MVATSCMQQYGMRRDPTNAEVPTVPARAVGAAGPEVGTVLARYRLIDVLGAGGMGIVYLALDPDLDREVALKVVHDEQLGLAAQERLRREARAMARIAHPNVVPVYEVGEHAGRTYYTMERIRGVSLRRWLEHARSWREIQHVFVDAGRGLAAIHAAGMVHRDVKPANILVGDDGRARITDLGIATADPAVIHGGLVDTTTIRNAGTPAFMAPEQLQGNAGDAASDQFAFGLSLYEALVGTSPFTAESRDQRLTDIAAGPPAMPARIPRWLEAVARRAIASDTADRFVDMPALLVALAHRPPRARALAVAALAVLAGGAIWLATGRAPDEAPCNHMTARLVGVWDVATRGRVVASLAGMDTAYAGFTALVVARELDAYADSWVTAQTETCRATWVRHEQSEVVLAARSACLDDRREGLHQLVTLLASPDRVMLGRAGSLVQTLAPVTDCTRDAQPPAYDRSDAEKLARAVSQLAVGHVEIAKRLANEVIQSAGTRGDPQTAAAAWLVRGRAELARDELPASVDSLTRATAEQTGPTVRIEAWTLLSRALQQLGRYDEADQVLGLADRALQEHPDRVRELAAGLARGTLLGRLGRYPEAWTLFVRMHELAARLYGSDSPELAASLENLATVARRLGRYDDAIARGNEAIRQSSVLGSEHPAVAHARMVAGAAYSDRGNYADALREFEAALAVFRAAGIDREVARAEADVAAVLTRMGRGSAAVPHFLAAIAVFDTLVPAGQAISARENLAVTYLELGLADDADPLLQTVLAERIRSLGPDHPTVAHTRELVARAAAERDRFADASRELELARASYVRTFGAEHPAVANVLALRANLERVQHRVRAARDLEVQALAIREHVLPADHPRIVDSMVAVARDLVTLDEWNAAVAMGERAVTLAPGEPSAAVVLAEALVGRNRGTDRARARELVRIARTALAASGRADVRLQAEINGLTRALP